MHTAFFFAIAVIVFSRLLFQWGEKELTWQRALLKSFVESLLLLPLYNDYFYGLALGILAFNTVAFGADQLGENKYLYRFLIFMAYVVGFAFLMGEKQFFGNFHGYVSQVIEYARPKNLMVQYAQKIGWHKLSVLLAGSLVVVNEVNQLIRYILSKLKVEPQIEMENGRHIIIGQQKDLMELRRGRVIGIIERLLIFFFTLSGNIATIGFILAAKGFTRFKELENKNFAEYVLIGTLLSASLALLVAVAVKAVIG
ncbi:hypothetical protein AAG747_12575 [Rapidithrix thailandica]|uniref:DUF3307 domain-containing protein n=1 Tax=Rapidithrix thailandica TaxID=413964 RepID=A0AAW9S8Q7_9BACT